MVGFSDNTSTKIECGPLPLTVCSTLRGFLNTLAFVSNDPQSLWTMKSTVKRSMGFYSVISEILECCGQKQGKYDE